MSREDTFSSRKGPWTEQEDLQLVWFVGLFGERRWDYLAKVSGLNRTGKSCRLRWVNYLHPGLKRGRMTPQEQHLVLELHAKWGNRWSRIARKLPGRTDNEIKNYWRTHMRKEAQEIRKRLTTSSSSPSPSSSSSSSSTSNLSSSTNYDIHLPLIEVNVGVEKQAVRDDDGVVEGTSLMTTVFEEINGSEGAKGTNYPPMDHLIWSEIATSELISFELQGYEAEEACCCPPVPSPTWDYYYCSDSLWKIDDEEFKVFTSMGDDDVIRES